MKKALSVILSITLFMALLIWSIPIFAVDGPTVECSDAVCNPGEQVTITVTLKNNPGIYILNMTTEFPAEFTLDKVTNGEIISDLTKGVNYLWTGDEADTTENGTLVTLKFTVPETATSGNYTVNFTPRKCANYNEDTFEVNVIPGTITVKSTAEPFSMEILGASIRTEEPYGMRFAVRVKDNSPKKIASYGVIMLPTEMLGANELTVNTSDVLNIPAKVFFEEGNPDYVEGAHTFTGVLMDIPDGAWDWAISARGYVKYEDGTYDYTDTISRTYIGIAKDCYADQTPEVQAILESIFGEGFALNGGVVGDDNTGVWKKNWD